MPFDIEYNEEKNEFLRRTREICFEDVREALAHNGYITVIRHKNRKKYRHQQILVVKIKNYVYAVPFVWDQKKNIAFLKTVYPDRKLTKLYLQK